jgi:pantetheine-phosphate adenylyltransferase
VKTALCPGTYDPVTVGHLDVISRCSSIFDEVVVAVVDDAFRKTVLFAAEERAQFLEESTKHLANVEVAVMRGLVVRFARAVSWTPTWRRCTLWLHLSIPSSARVGSRR